MTRQYLKDLFERVASTFLETVAGSLVLIQVVVGTTGTKIAGGQQLEATLASAGTAAGAALLKGLAASLRGDPNSASLASSVSADPILRVETNAGRTAIAKAVASLTDPQSASETVAAGAASQSSVEAPPEAPQGAALTPGPEVPPAAAATDAPTAEQAGALTLPAPAA